MSKVAAPPTLLRAPRPGRSGRAVLIVGGLGLLALIVPSSSKEGPSLRGPSPRLALRLAATPTKVTDGKVAKALGAIAACREAYRKVADYTCTFVKRERPEGGILSGPHIMAMKARSDPRSVYFKFQCPKPGREAIYVEGRDGGRAMVHDVGLAKLLAGTLALDPRGGMAMDDCRHPITEAGIGHMIETISGRWADEMREGETLVAIDPEAVVDDRPCTMVESTHPRKRAEFLFHSVKVFIDRELHLPIRFEAYDWPAEIGLAPELVEEYTFRDLRLNVGLTDADFDPANPSYSFGRF